MACDAVNFGGRTEQDPCPGNWGNVGLGFCSNDDYVAVRRTLILEHNALVRAIKAFNLLVGTKTTAARWGKPGSGYQGQTIPAGIITWDGSTNAAYYTYEESLALLDANQAEWVIVTNEGDILAMLKMAMKCHAATCDMEDALVAAGASVPQKPEAPPEDKSIAREILDFTRDAVGSAGKGLALLAGGTVLAILGYNYATQRKANRW
jgi:hypothetical protein